MVQLNAFNSERPFPKGGCYARRDHHLPVKSEEARNRFPHLDHEPTLNDLTVISDQGAVYFGPKAWLMVLWALCRYREWSYRLASPELLPTTRRVVIDLTT